GYFTGSSEPKEAIRYTYGYDLPHRGFTRNDGTDNSGFSRLSDGDLNTYWKSNPYLAERFTGEKDSLHPQWVVVDLSQPQQIDALRIRWADPFAAEFLVQFWTGDDPIHLPTRGIWQTFPNGSVNDGKGGTQTLRLSQEPQPVRFVRIWMTASSNTCDTHGAADPRNCVGYAIRELYLGTMNPEGEFADIVRHTPDQEQTTTYCSSVDPWHAPEDLGSTKQAHMGFDLFFSSGVTRGLPAVVPVAVLYDTPENAAAEMAYLEKRHYPVSYVEIGEEADGQYMLPEDYAALYVEWATALHRVDPSLKLGGPSFQGVNRDIETWPDQTGEVSWTVRFLKYLRAHNRLNDLAFFSFEHYPYEPCRIPWGSLYDEPELIGHIMQTWRDDGVPHDIPMLITESNLSSAASETSLDLFSGLWLADYVGSFLNNGGKGLYFFHYLPLQMEHGCNDSPGTFGFFTVDANYQVQQPLAQFFASQLINSEWIRSPQSEYRMFPAKSDLGDGAGHALITAYALRGGEQDWSVMIVNRDQFTAHRVRLQFTDDDRRVPRSFEGQVAISTFGREQYQWHPATTAFMAHSLQAAQRSVIENTKGYADPDGPIVNTNVAAAPGTSYKIPAASIVVLRGKLGR
ncbi:MAG: discoidin domain-containing protein, partial [Acidobacteria bacterium]|nr:discoidin domain-containing protein [Acidobacteriota bacterium]